MLCEILSVGTELLMGQIANTDAQFLARRLSAIGITMHRTVTVGDNPGRVKEALNEALSRADLVITTGGLGPTEDDLTKEMVAEYFGLPMRLHQESLDKIERYFASTGRKMTDNNRKQALFPEGCRIMPNRKGTAPGCIVERDGKRVAYMHDTGVVLPEVWDYFKALDRPLDLVSLDAVCGPNRAGEHSGHMSFEQDAEIRMEMLRTGVANEQTQFISNHICIHSCKKDGKFYFHEDMEIFCKPLGLTPSYDGMAVTL